MYCNGCRCDSDEFLYFQDFCIYYFVNVKVPPEKFGQLCWAVADRTTVLEDLHVLEVQVLEVF